MKLNSSLGHLQSISIEEGEDKRVELVARRYAYSCYGTVRSLNGDPEKFVPVEAISPEGQHEETQTDINGEYRYFSRSNLYN